LTLTNKCAINKAIVNVNECIMSHVQTNSLVKWMCHELSNS